MSARPRPAEPWERRHLWILGVGQTIALALVLGAWLGASSEVRVADQTGWLRLGVVAAAAAGVLNGGFLFRGRWSLVRRRRAIFRAHEYPRGHETPAVGSPVSDTLLVAAAAMTRYHRPECLLVAGKAVIAANRAVHTDGRREPCGVCKP